MRASPGIGVLAGGATTLLLGLAAAGPSAWAAAPAPAAAAPVSAVEARARLEQGNRRFVSGHPTARATPEQRTELAKGQSPYAIVLTCSDSRVPPEIIFDESLGRLFVVRVAGNVVDSVGLGSIEYAVEHLHSHLLLVMGHDQCGAVQAALQGGNPPSDLPALTERIAPAIARVHDQGSGAPVTIDAVVRENVRLAVEEATRESKLLAEFVAHKELEIDGAVYHLGSGKVEWLIPAGGAGARGASP